MDNSQFDFISRCSPFETCFPTIFPIESMMDFQNVVHCQVMSNSSSFFKVHVPWIVLDFPWWSHRKIRGKPAKKHQASPCRVHALVMGSPSPLRRAGDRRGWDGARAGVLIPSGDTLIRDKWGSNDIFPFFPISSIRRVSSLAARWLAWITSLESQAASAQWRYIRLP